MTDELNTPEEEQDDEVTSIYRLAFITGYEQGIADGRRQGKEALIFFVKTALSDVYDEHIQSLISRLEGSLDIE